MSLLKIGNCNINLFLCDSVLFDIMLCSVHSLCECYFRFAKMMTLCAHVREQHDAAEAVVEQRYFHSYDKVQSSTQINCVML